jgi:hypothetical protein
MERTSARIAEPPGRAEVLALWERGRGLHPVDRALLLLGAAFPEAPLERLAALTVGERDAALLALRRAAFGGRLPGYADCPRCGVRLEFALDADALRVADAPPVAPSPPDGGGAGRTVRLADGTRFRVPTSADLAGAAGAATPEAAALALAELCLVEGGRDGALASRLAELDARLAEADPQADVALDFACDACGHAWQCPFDIGAYLWEEIEAQAARLLADVHALARAYGWREDEILALSDARRAAYLELVGA